MKTNIYWPVYKNIEEEFNKLMFSIHIDDDQLNVYSSKISDLILRAATEIESLSKELYRCNGGTKTERIKYDEDAINYLSSQWFLEEKEVIISSYNCFITNRTLYPFKKDEQRTGNSRLTYNWNNSYQNLKHDRANSLSYGSIKYLFSATAALFLLNIYYKDNTFSLGKDSLGLGFDESLGSSIFSVKLHSCETVSFNDSYTKNENYNSCVYLSIPTEKMLNKLKEFYNDALKKENDLLLQQIASTITDTLHVNNLTTEQMESVAKEVFNKRLGNNISNVMTKNKFEIGRLFMDLEYDAVLNKNQL